MSQPERQRIDKWLFFARIIKSRTLAGKFAAAGNVRVNGEKIDQARFPIKPGDTLTIKQERRVVVLRVLGTGHRRGPAPEAQLLYDDITPKPVEAAAAEAGAAQREPGAGRPTKRDRRKMDQFRNSDAGA
ncbi:RNA-binding S4 domain-containing protein [Hoeflea sp. YIM 152468]|uniref:RNA-binding S4 domain-containing protein n=1 Tax=Hoeflea sp. YIM 152468 TaxID=3031759 RepID=UPI0023DC2DD1|nr:RNA-binding S4 domain-containing protein [Hoeflea sp. YIM 152468]MDF1608122.1 RNA-binding S4 domain-containing protein [Hoeflea sp. YIM 152468]